MVDIKGQHCPLVVDLDGTLILTDMLHRSLLQIAMSRPWALLLAPLWLCRGRPYFKWQVAQRVQLDPATLPFNPGVMRLLKQHYQASRGLVLATGSSASHAVLVAGHVGLFAHVLSSENDHNLKAANKARVLVELFGEKGFDYIGNSHADIPVWQCARIAYVTNPDPGLMSRLERIGIVNTPIDIAAQ